MASALTVNASLQMTTAGIPLCSSSSPSATADALQEPQSPTPVTTMSHSARSSAIIGSGAVSTMLGFFLASTVCTPYCVRQFPSDLRQEILGIALGVGQQAQPKPGQAGGPGGTEPPGHARN